MPASHAGPVLIVDDDDDAREALRTLLENVGHPTVTAEGADAALDRLRAGLRPCLILLDLMMPVKDGFQFRREQVADPDLASIPVVIYSAYHNVYYAALELGVAGYFRKPVEVDTLLDVVGTYRCRD
jgi:CheY-like chemotaxis protein